MQDDGPIPLDDRALPDYLRALGVAGPEDRIEVEPAGDGNINWVRRARVPARGVAVVVKQARPALERFPQYQASTERIVFEQRWLEIARPLDAGGVCPAVLHFDEARRVLVLEDLGDAERLDHALARGADVTRGLHAIVALLAAVHGATHDPALAARFRNDDMRRLHGEHVFHLPFVPNDFPLEPALAERARRVWDDRPLVEIAATAYRRYLEPRGALVHADVQPGNVLLRNDGRPVLLDAEIAHVGDPAFDVGTLLAHVLLWGVARDALAASADVAAGAWRAYAQAAGSSDATSADVARYVGIEMIRRTIGAARVAAVADTATALHALDVGIRLARRPPASPDALVANLRSFAP